MKIIYTTLALILLPCFVMAADIPSLDIGADEYDEAMCVQRYKNMCASTICLTSEARDCVQKCKEGAKDKCKQEAVN